MNKTSNISMGESETKFSLFDESIGKFKIKLPCKTNKDKTIQFKIKKLDCPIIMKHYIITDTGERIPVDLYKSTRKSDVHSELNDPDHLIDQSDETELKRDIDSSVSCLKLEFYRKT